MQVLIFVMCVDLLLGLFDVAGVESHQMRTGHDPDFYDVCCFVLLNFCL